MGRLSIASPSPPVVGARSALEASLLRAGVATAVALGVTELVSHVVNEVAFDGRYRHLNADTEWNLWAWEGSASFFAASVVTFLCATAIPAWRGRLGLLTVWFAFLSLDDVVEVHERLGIRFGSATGLASGEEAGRLWVVVYLPAMILSLVILLRLARALCSPQARRILHCGLAVIGAAVAAEITGAATRRLGGSLGWLYDLNVGLEEAAESAGWLLVATGLAGALFSAVASAGSGARQASASPRGGGAAAARTTEPG